MTPESATTATVVDGNALADGLRDDITATVEELTAKGHRPPGLTVVQVGDDPASNTYVTYKIKACKECGIVSNRVHLPESVEQAQLLDQIENLNGEAETDGILVQLPLPDHIDNDAVVASIAEEKDVDCLHPSNFGLLAKGCPRFVSCTPRGIVHILDSHGFAIEGSDAVIVGRSEIVGRPLSYLLLNRNATVTVCHSRTADLAAKTRAADLLVSAVGKPGLISGDMVAEGAAVIDVGITPVYEEVDGEEKKRLKGDVDFEAAKRKASLITPVPGGVGPLTIASLLRNTLTAYRLREPAAADAVDLT